MAWAERKICPCFSVRRIRRWKSAAERHEGRAAGMLIKNLHPPASCDTISLVDEQVSLNGGRERVRNMGKRYYVVKEQAVPEVLLKVVEAKKLLDTGKAHTINDAAELAGISRSSFYKYKEDIFEFHENSQGTTITLSLQMEDEPGLLSDVLKIIAQFGANILTIHQSIPINGMASLSLSIQVLSSTGNISEMLEVMEGQKGVRNVKILAKE